MARPSTAGPWPCSATARGTRRWFSVSRESELPAFTLWKNTGGLRSGYVTGLEPATNYPNPRPFEQARQRVITLPPDGTYDVETILEVLDTEEAVSTVEAEVQALQAQGVPRSTAGPSSRSRES